eukprot:459101-Rhodomonas_salina.1
MVYHQALYDLATNSATLRFKITQLHAGGGELADADLVIASYASKSNAVLAWSQDVDFFFLWVNWWCDRSLNTRKCTVCSKDAILKALGMTRNAQLRALAYRRGNENFRGKEVKQVSNSKATVECLDLWELRLDMQADRLGRYEPKISHALAKIDSAQLVSFLNSALTYFKEHPHPLSDHLKGVLEQTLDLLDLRHVQVIETLLASKLNGLKFEGTGCSRRNISRLLLLINVSGPDVSWDTILGWRR